MSELADRRRALRIGAGILTAGLALGDGARTQAASPQGPAPTAPSLVTPEAKELQMLMRRLAGTARRRDFKTVPMILTDPADWDDAALRLVLGYGPATKQVWNNSKIESPWLSLMRNALNVQIWSFKHPDFLVASATHGSAQLALYDEATWTKYQLTKLAGDAFKTNTLIVEKPGSDRGLDTYEDPKGIVSGKENSIPLLMRRGVVFLACHNAIWEQAGKLIEKGLDPDKRDQGALAAELSNHLIEGVVLTPGAVAALPELQHAGFHYAS